MLDVPFTGTARRMALRDASQRHSRHPSMRRYVDQRLYLATCRPRDRATLVLDGAAGEHG
ncbi:hypothetical protein GCM10012276_28090 [Nocardioides deserti]|nr:hypothetical protein GCM10012276_28090 [Nocardioides deserti]